jgi:hypothetical protein
VSDAETDPGALRRQEETSRKRFLDVLAAARSIVQVEARHAALIRPMRGQTPAPSAFDPKLDQQQVLDAVCRSSAHGAARPRETGGVAPAPRG